MAKKFTINFAVVIPILALVVSALVLIFGNNVFEKITAPKITMESTKVMLNFPNGINQALNEYALKSNITNLPSCYRIVTIKNNGSIVSKNINIRLRVDGDIFDSVVVSTENITDKKQIDASTYAIQMARLSKNATVEIRVWVKDSTLPFDVEYIDDYNSRKLIQNNASNKGFPTIQILMVAIIFMCLGFIGKQIFMKVSENLQEQRVEREYQLIMRLNEMFNEKAVQTDKDEEEREQQENINTNSENTKEILKDFIRKVNDLQ